MEARSRFRAMLRDGEMIVAPGAFDALTGRVVESLGFNAVYVGGWVTGAHLACGEPLLTLTEQVETAGRVARAVRTPVIVDGHAGFGEPLHVTRTVAEFEAAGVAAIHLEDQVFPKRAGYHRGTKHVIPAEEMVAKVKAALRARQDPDFAIIARTDALGAVGGSLEEAIRRMKAYDEAGADALMPMAYDPRQAEAIASALPGRPLVWQGGVGGQKGTPELSIAEVRDIGYRIIIYSVSTTLEAIRAIRVFYQGIKETGKAAYNAAETRETSDFVLQSIGLARHLEIEDGAGGQLGSRE